MSKNTLNEIWKSNVDSMTIEQLTLQLEINQNIAKQVELFSKDFLEGSNERKKLCSILQATQRKVEYITDILEGNS